MKILHSEIDIAAEPISGVDPSQSIRSFACRNSQMMGTVDDARHHAFGPAFALTETGSNPALTAGIRARLLELGVPVHDSCSPELMDLVAWHRVKPAKAA